MSKKFLILASLLLTIDAFATPLHYINSLRIKSGTSTLKYSSVLSKASKHHASYVDINGEYSHYENMSSANFYAITPWSRIIKAGYGTKVVIENISYLEPTFKASIDKIMGTVYHRLAFLYPKIDTIGYATVGKIYVYDMSNSKIAKLCSKHYKNAEMIIDRVCPNNKDIVPQRLFNKEMTHLLKGSKDIIIYPYRNQKNVPLMGVEEAPKFLDEDFGFPITVTFNDNYYKNVKLVSFKLYGGANEVPTKVVSSANDINNKIRENTFVLVPLDKLKPSTTYSVELKFKSNGKQKVKKWSFTTH